MRNDTAIASSKKDRQISFPPGLSDTEEAITAVHAPTSYVDRRTSMPTAVLENEIANFSARKKGKVLTLVMNVSSSIRHTIIEKDLLKQQHGFNGRKASTLPRRFSLNSKKKETGKPPSHPPPPKPFHRAHSPQEPYEYDLPQHATEPTDLTSLHPPTGHLTRNGYSHSHALNQIRHDLNSTIHPGMNTTKAWHSNPATRPSSRNPSRHGSQNPSRSNSRAPSSSSIRTPLTGSDHLNIIDDDVEELTFHDVESHTVVIPDGETHHKRPRAFSIGGGSSGTAMEQEDHLPSLPVSPQHALHRPIGRRRRTHSDVSEKRNGFLSQAVTFEMPTDLDTSTIVAELVQIAEELKMRDLVSCRGVVIGVLKGVRIQIQIRKDDHGMCHIAFQWMSGGNLKSYQDICDSFMLRARL